MVSSQPPSELVTAGQLAATIHQAVGLLAKPETNLLEIEKFIKTEIKRAGMKPAFLGYKNYPAASCLSVNSVIVHGIPRSYRLKTGDVLSVDLGVSNNGWIVDTAVTHAIGSISPETEQLLEVTNRALTEVVSIIKPGIKVGDIGAKIQSIVEEAGFYIIKELTGHGVGRSLQMPPTIPNYGRSGTGALIKPGMILAIEPITALKPVSVTVDDDNWTIRAQPDVICAHFEHTIFVTETGSITLTSINK